MDAAGGRSSPVVHNVERDLGNQRRRRARRTGNVNPRDRLFHALFIKIAYVYARVIPKRFRVLLEVIVLFKGILLFSFLSYLHFSFGRAPMSCLNTSNSSWPRDGILRVQIQPELGLSRQLPRFLSYKENVILFHPCHADKEYNPIMCNTMAKEMKEFYKYNVHQYHLNIQSYRMNLSDFLYQRNNKNWKSYYNFEYVMADHEGSLFAGFNPGEIIQEGKLLAFYEKYLVDSGDHERHYIFEYSQEFGFLRLSPETRTRLKIPIKIVTLDPNKDKCFGDSFSRFLLKYCLGYDDVLMNSIKKVADIENNTGYMLNVVTGDHYKFVPWGIGRGSYFISLLLMFLFTISISTLLRYCHQQVFFFIIHILQMLDMNVVLAFPVAPLFTVVLSLVGMETIMSEYFNDTTTSFYIILIVWAVDQFDTICCHTEISQRYWLRFFYLYHFLFYAYHYRFNGQYSALALAATWFLIQHSMLYFFHNYELPVIENNRDNINREDETYLDEAVQMIVEGIELVAGQQQQQQQQGLNTSSATPVISTNAVDTEEIPQAVNDRVQEISAGANGTNRIFIFAADRPFIQMVRDFIRNIHERMNTETVEPITPGQEQVNSEENSDEMQHNDSNTIFTEPATTDSGTLQVQNESENVCQNSEIDNTQTFNNPLGNLSAVPNLQVDDESSPSLIQELASLVHEDYSETAETLYHQTVPMTEKSTIAKEESVFTESNPSHSKEPSVLRIDDTVTSDVLNNLEFQEHVCKNMTDQSLSRTLLQEHNYSVNINEETSVIHAVNTDRSNSSTSIHNSTVIREEPELD